MPLDCGCVEDANMPTIFGWKPFVEAGGLMSYGPNLRESFFRLALFIDKILKGTKPNDIPIEQPTKRPPAGAISATKGGRKPESSWR
jgi:ABC-type uncharacterized transport system substrate-binding protein